MALLGGIGTVFGPLAGAFTFVSLQNYLAPLGSWVLIVQGAIFVLCVAARRHHGPDLASVAGRNPIQKGVLMFLHVVMLSLSADADARFHERVQGYCRRILAECDGVAAYAFLANEASRADG